MGSIRRSLTEFIIVTDRCFAADAILIDAQEYFPSTARRYEKTVEELKRRKRGRENEARMVGN
jgi:hypothetical protein